MSHSSRQWAVFIPLEKVSKPCLMIGIEAQATNKMVRSASAKAGKTINSLNSRNREQRTLLMPVPLRDRLGFQNRVGLTPPGDRNGEKMKEGVPWYSSAQMRVHHAAGSLCAGWVRRVFLRRNPPKVSVGFRSAQPNLPPPPNPLLFTLHYPGYPRPHSRNASGASLSRERTLSTPPRLTASHGIP